MKPVIVMTVYRRYHELAASIDRIHELKHEFREEPDVIVVWAQPEVSRLWFFQDLLSSKKISHFLTRDKLPEEQPGCATTYPESVSIRMGLEYAKSHYCPFFAYIIFQCADIMPRPDMSYRFIDKHMNEMANAVVFHWENSCVRSGVWHTNFFATCFDERYWPPIAEFNSEDVLERQWGLLLAQREMPGIIESHNFQNKKFFHNHDSEKLTEWPIKPQEADSSFSLFINGYLPWYKKLWRCIFRNGGN